MQILSEKPAIAKKIEERFDVKYDDGDLIITYFPEIHTKRGFLTPDLLIHELVHIRQQEKDPEIWWAMFFSEPNFRFQQEVEAYRMQWEWYKENIKDRNRLYLHKVQIAKDLSGKMYGNIVTYDEAIRLFK